MITLKQLQAGILAIIEVSINEIDNINSSVGWISSY